MTTSPGWRSYSPPGPEGHAFLVMVSSLPNGYVTAVPCDLRMVRAEHHLMALAASTDEALAQLQQTLAGKKRDDLLPPV